ncbi:GntR family transcriptional regulator [Arthrobacter sp. B2a2-09]|uniref:GntR family transcriptional regulator n=1 Tax=Arthrobacter sp. B2a2-09 TaxID=2952822 RepID=UPI0022CDA3B9|nr:GntR family transcriptional regulator [Arthrobacter sp. B2a2-09]MCZ9883061.1 GntR family transcriptional regulator [Arthrobacter sp. B2a2-09]
MAAQAAKGIRPLSEHVYDRISNEIVNGVVEPGAPLVQEQLAEEYGVSRTPVRDALNRLVHEGLATLVPGAGYFATTLTRSAVEEVYEVRKALEIMAIRQCGAKYTNLQLARLELLIAEGAASADPEELFTATRAFHLGLAAPAPNGFLLKTLESVWDNPVQRLISRSYPLDDAKLERVADAHRKILAAARANDLETLIPLLDLCHEKD